MIAAVLPSMAGVVAWWLCVANGLGLDATSIVVGLVVLLPATPLAIVGRAGGVAHRSAACAEG